MVEYTEIIVWFKQILFELTHDLGVFKKVVWSHQKIKNTLFESNLEYGWKYWNTCLIQANLFELTHDLGVFNKIVCLHQKIKTHP